MEGPYPSKPQLWEGWASTLAQDLLEAEHQRCAPGPHHPAEFAQRLYACEALKSPALPAEEAAEPYSLQWFLDIETQRHGRQGRWIPKLLEFAKHPGETLLGLGHGLGTDWLQYARHGASVVVCSPSAEQLALIRRNFELRGLSGRFVHTGFAPLPLDNSSIDVACVSSLLHEVAQPAAVIDEIYRVLKPGGKVLAVVPAYYDIDYWTRLLFLGRGRLADEQRWREASGMLAPSAGRFKRKDLRRLFHRFQEPRVSKRHLRRAEVPHLWRWLPLSLVERLAGRLLVFKGFKPVSAARADQAPAAYTTPAPGTSRPKSPVSDTAA